MNLNTTIASISTALTPAGVGIIRISGKDSFKIINQIFTNKNKKPIEVISSHKIHYGFIYDKNNDKFLDEVIVLSFKSPKSFTSEDTIEIQAHGGVLILKQILDLVLSKGASLAEPGEFTKRAYLNGRIDLSQAEAVIDLINSENQMSIDASISQLKGNLKNKISEFKKELLESTAFIEACLDDPEHMSIDGYKNTLLTKVKSISEDIKSTISTFDDGRIIKEGIKTVILGEPNVGKSSLLNTLLNENRAIVSNIAGTTRDTIKENINIDGVTLNIVDTAGIRGDENIFSENFDKENSNNKNKNNKKSNNENSDNENSGNENCENININKNNNTNTDTNINSNNNISNTNTNANNSTNIFSNNNTDIDIIEKIGIEKAKNEAENADLIIFVIDSSNQDNKENEIKNNKNNLNINLLNKYKNKKIIILFNKIDLYAGDRTQLTAQLKTESPNTTISELTNNCIYFSSVTKEGLTELKTKIKNMFFNKKIDFNNQIYISNKRHLEELKQTDISLSNLISTIENNMPEDLYTIDLMDAITHLSKILGEDMSDELVNTIFSKFCMGK